MTAIDRPAADALLVQFTDTHLSAEPQALLRGISPARTLEAVVALAGPWLRRADHTILTGDLTHDGRTEGAHRLRELIAPLCRSFSYLPGNHDNPATLATALKGQSGNWPRSVRVKGWDLLLLNSHLPGSDGGQVGVTQRERLETWLSEHVGRPVLIAVHHHPVPVGSPWMDEMALSDGAPLMELLCRHSQVRGILFGHIHQCFESRVAQLRLFGSPSTCMQFEPRSTTSHSDGRMPGFRWLKLRADGTIDSGVERLTAWPDGIAPTR